MKKKELKFFLLLKKSTPVFVYKFIFVLFNFDCDAPFYD